MPWGQIAFWRTVGLEDTKSAWDTRQAREKAFSLLSVIAFAPNCADLAGQLPTGHDRPKALLLISWPKPLDTRMPQVNAKDGSWGETTSKTLETCCVWLACSRFIHGESEQCMDENMIIDHLGCMDKCGHSSLNCEHYNVSECLENGPFWDKIFNRRSIKNVLLQKPLGMPQWMFLSHFEQLRHWGLGTHRRGARAGAKRCWGEEWILQDTTPFTFDPFLLPKRPISKAVGTCCWGKLGGAEIGQKLTLNWMKDTCPGNPGPGPGSPFQ